LLLLILLILFCIYRLRKKDEGSYSLEEPQKGPATSNAYMRAPSREFYA
uniref:4.1m domain-containing protein n=1 Tax=Hydatigena taeniaeformis TaxID=6205 RepID=A0A0R3WQC4_HYDTA